MLLVFFRLQISQLQHRSFTHKCGGSKLRLYCFLLLVAHEQRLSPDMEGVVSKVQKYVKMLCPTSKQSSRGYSPFQVFVNTYSSVRAQGIRDLQFQRCRSNFKTKSPISLSWPSNKCQNGKDEIINFGFASNVSENDCFGCERRDSRNSTPGK